MFGKAYEKEVSKGEVVYRFPEIGVNEIKSKDVKKFFNEIAEDIIKYEKKTPKQKALLKKDYGISESLMEIRKDAYPVPESFRMEAYDDAVKKILEEGKNNVIFDIMGKHPSKTKYVAGAMGSIISTEFIVVRLIDESLAGIKYDPILSVIGGGLGIAGLYVGNHLGKWLHNKAEEKRSGKIQALHCLKMGD
ncbi:MAG: hypothetical protein HZB68_00830 [Candidatus Aenigmarchaeota archaeon]|nr:hypothetical protein [Candidatus Aenigmarchaeota archaeon]